MTFATVRIAVSLVALFSVAASTHHLVAALAFVKFVVLTEVPLLACILVVLDGNLLVFSPVLVVFLLGVELLRGFSHLIDDDVAGIEGLNEFVKWLEAVLLSLFSQLLYDTDQNIGI